MTLVTLWKKYQAWENRRWRKHVQSWERKRRKGRPHFALLVALVWGGLMILVSSASEYFLRHNFESWILLMKGPIYLIGGYLVGLIGWSSNENKYQTFLREASQDVHRVE
jgi:hypothetical protein